MKKITKGFWEDKEKQIKKILESLKTLKDLNGKVEKINNLICLNQNRGKDVNVLIEGDNLCYTSEIKQLVIKWLKEDLKNPFITPPTIKIWMKRFNITEEEIFIEVKGGQEDNGKKTN